MSFHKDVQGTDNHVIHSFTYANQSLRLAATLTATDVGKIALQSSDLTYWVLTNWSPMSWKDITSQGGGGGGGLDFLPGSTTSPIQDVEFNQTVWEFADGALQHLYSTIKVPTSYLSGNPIKLKIEAYSPSSANTWQLLTVASLIRKAVDAAGSTTNQRTSTNSAITNLSANISQEIVFDLSDSSGLINGVAVSAGDVIEIDLYRNTGTSDTADIRFRNSSSEVTFV